MDEREVHSAKCSSAVVYPGGDTLGTNHSDAAQPTPLESVPKVPKEALRSGLSRPDANWACLGMGVGGAARGQTLTERDMGSGVFSTLWRFIAAHVGLQIKIHTKI